MAEHCEPMRAGQPCGSAADDGDGLARGLGALEQLRVVIENRVGCVALQAPDFDGFVLVRVAHTGLLAQYLGRADARAHSTHDVLGQNRTRGTADIVATDLLNKGRYIDAGGAGRRARRVVTEITAVSLNQGLRPAQRRMQVAEVTLNIGLVEATGTNIGVGLWCGHRRLDASSARLQLVLRAAP